MMKRNVLITGASSGIGKAIAYAFAENGDNLVITGRRFDKLEEIKTNFLRRSKGRDGSFKRYSTF